MFIEHGSVCWHTNLGDTTSEIEDSGGPVLIESKTGQRILVGVIAGGHCANSEEACTQGWS